MIANTNTKTPDEGINYQTKNPEGKYLWYHDNK